MTNKTCLLFHPYKPALPPEKLNCYSHEMGFVADYLYEVLGYKHVRLHTGGALCDNFDELWISCFKPVPEKPVVLPWNKPIRFIFNDPDFFLLPACLKGHPDLKIYFCGQDWLDCLNKLGPTEPGFWYPQETEYLPLWPFMFKKIGRPSYSHIEKLSDFRGKYALGYVGNTRSDYRHRRLKSLCNNGLNKQFIGYNKPLDVPNVSYWPKQIVPKAHELSKDCIAQLVVGDRAYTSLFPQAHRFLQGLCLSPLVFVDEEIGEKAFTEYPLLKELFLVKDSADILFTYTKLEDKPMLLKKVLEQFSELFTGLTNA